MPNALEEALDCCAVNFDRRVVITSLLNDYQLSYEQTQKTLQQHIAEQEKRGEKFSKRFLLQGEDAANNKYVYTVVEGEENLQKWLRKLKNAESSLYSVEITGGAKAAADDFVPLRNYAIKLANVETREIPAEYKGLPYVNVPKQAAAAATKLPANQLSKAFAKQVTTAAAAATTNTKTATAAAAVPVKKTSPEDKKPAVKKGVNNFFTSAAAEADAKNKKAESKVAKTSPTPTKKSQDFFKKQPNKTDVKLVNKSMQLFSEATEQTATKAENTKQNASIAVFDSSDEEQQASVADDDDEDDIITTRKKTNTSKRRRILDSDDEENAADEPQQKQEKKELMQPEAEVEQQQTAEEIDCETYLDDEGFVVTKRLKKTTSASKVKPASSPKKPAAAAATATAKSPAKIDKKTSKNAAAAGKPKTKQGNIMSFFSKK